MGQRIKNIQTWRRGRAPAGGYGTLNAETQTSDAKESTKLVNKRGFLDQADQAGGGALGALMTGGGEAEILLYTKKQPQTDYHLKP